MRFTPNLPCRRKVTSDMDSYGLLDLDQQVEQREWRDTIDSDAIIICDLNIGRGTTASTVNSLRPDKVGLRRGSVAWNDQHVTFEIHAHDFTTKCGNEVNGGNDDLFEDDDRARGDAQKVFGGPDLPTE